MTYYAEQPVREDDATTADGRCDDCGHPIWTDEPWSFAECKHPGGYVQLFCQDCAVYRKLRGVAS